MISRLIKKLRERPERLKRRASEAQQDRQRPASAYNDDTFIVSFPKAGNTWFAFLIANVNLLINRQPTQATWWNVRDYVFSIGDGRQLPPNPLAIPSGRFIHSHYDFTPHYGKVIYLIRDPRDTLVSLYDMTTKLGMFEGTMDQFLESDAYGIPAWNRHVGGWVTKHGHMSRVYFIRYEDLKADPREVLTRIYRLFGLNVEPELLDTAIKRSTFTAMTESEAEYRRYSYDVSSSFQFIRKGKVGGFTEEITPEQTARIETRCAEWMKMFNYLPSDKPVKN